MIRNKLTPFTTAAALRRKYVPRHLLSPKAKKKPKHFKGVYNGNFFRIKKPKQQRPFLKLPKIPPPAPIPKPFVPVSPKASFENKALPPFTEQILQWLRQNWTVLVLNFGSLCTLTGFTRSDVLELRSLSIMGSLSFTVYGFFLKDRRWAPIAWSTLFASVNAAKIAQILHDRSAKVTLSEQDQVVYEHFFLPHGMTPKQFEIVQSKSKRIKIKRGDIVIRQGTPLKHLYLVIEGQTRANILGRHLTAASSGPHRREKVGGDSGAWVGEMIFLQWYSEGTRGAAATTPPNNEQEGPVKAPYQQGAGLLQTMYTVVAKEDCTLLQWTHNDMKELMSRSTDLRASLTRAMTAAIVGKVVNFTVAKSASIPTWSAWLDDWKHNAGAKMVVKQSQPHFQEDDNEEDDEGGDADIDLHSSAAL